MRTTLFVIAALFAAAVAGCSPDQPPSGQTAASADDPIPPGRGVWWVALCQHPDDPANRPPPFNKGHWSKLIPTARQRCIACPEIPGNHASECNRTNWDCAGSAMYAPYDASSCDSDCPCLKLPAP